MKRTLAITAATALLALSLAGCGDMADRPADGGAAAGGTTATDTMHNDGAGQSGTGTTGGASANNGGLGSVTGAARYGANGSAYGPTGWSAYTARNNGGWMGGAVPAEQDAQASADRYALMLENGRVHDTDGFLLDGENTSWRTY